MIRAKHSNRRFFACQPDRGRRFSRFLTEFAGSEILRSLRSHRMTRSEGLRMTGGIVKRSHSRLRLGLTLALVASFCFLTPCHPGSANAGTMRWTVADTPSSTGNVIVSPSEINAIASGSDGRTFYAVDIPHSKVYKSVNGGISWDDLVLLPTSANITLPAWDISAAPDNPNFVAVVASDAGLPREVLVSTDGGASWQDTNCPVTNNIAAIDISPNYGSYDVVVGTRTGAGGGDVYMFKAASGAWSAQGFAGDILAVEFSPRYAADSSLVTVSADATSTYLNLGIHDTFANTTDWGTWGPVEITTSGSGTSPNAAQIMTADLELPFDFSGQAPSLRRIYVSTDAPTSNAGIYRFDDTVGHQLMAATTNQRISSIAYYGTYGAGKLLAGELLSGSSPPTIMTWFTDAPITCPGTCWYPALKPPTGGANSGYANAQVAWSPDGSRAFCGTSSANLDAAGWPLGCLTTQPLDESAFSVTLDDGQTWNQLSLIDTEITFLSDVVASAASDILHLASINANSGDSGFDSLWRSIGYPPARTWERVLCLRAATDDTILRVSQGAAGQSVFLGVCSTSDLLHSRDMGQTWHSTHPGVNLTDFAVIEINGTLHMYVLENNFVRKGESTNEAWRWGRKVDTSLNSGHTISTTPGGAVVVGDAGGGMVAYSGHGGAQFAWLPAVPVPGNMHVVADARILNYIVIYAASDGARGKIDCWVVGPSSEWTSMGSPGQSFYGLAQAGTLYGAWPSGTSTSVDRTLNPEAISSVFVQWDTLAAGLDDGVVFTREPTSLKVSGNVDLWAIDNRNYDWQNREGCLWVFSDCLTGAPQLISPPSQELLLKAPTLISPAKDEVISIDPDAADIAVVSFKWEHPTPAQEYELWLAKDEEFSQMVIQQTIVPNDMRAPTWALSSEILSAEASETYYWKTKVTRAATGESGDGEWSEVMSFSVASNLSPETFHSGYATLSPAEDATDVKRRPSFSWPAIPGATEYQFTLAEDEALEQRITSVKVSQASNDYDAELDWGTTYFWQVKVTKPFLSEPSPIFTFTVAAQEESALWSRLTNLPIWVWIGIALLAAASITFFAIRKTKPGIFKGAFGKARG